MKLTLKLEKLLDEAEGIRKGHRLRCFPGAETCEVLRVINDLAYRLKLLVDDVRNVVQYENPDLSGLVETLREVEEPQKQ